MKSSFSRGCVTKSNAAFNLKFHFKLKLQARANASGMITRVEYILSLSSSSSLLFHNLCQEWIQMTAQALSLGNESREKVETARR